MTNNYFEELHSQGIVTCELSIQELQDLLAQDRITVDQFTQIIVHHIGIHKFMEAFHNTLRSAYNKDIL